MPKSSPANRVYRLITVQALNIARRNSKRAVHTQTRLQSPEKQIHKKQSKCKQYFEQPTKQIEQFDQSSVFSRFCTN